MNFNEVPKILINSIISIHTKISMKSKNLNLAKINDEPNYFKGPKNLNVPKKFDVAENVSESKISMHPKF